MRIVLREADRLSGLLSDFLLYARPGSPKIAAVDVSAVLDELALLAAGDPRFAGIEIRRAYPPGVSMPLDRQQLYQAMLNLVINGAEAMPDGGVLTIGLGPGEREIFVEDSGPGIPENIRNRIFNPFFTTKDHGTGLGLATVHAIVEAHGGSVSVAAGSRGGARFVIQLPASFPLP
jgi:two-component system sensor histidine kinase PilS (NtrC family)